MTKQNRGKKYNLKMLSYITIHFINCGGSSSLSIQSFKLSYENVIAVSLLSFANPNISLSISIFDTCTYTCMLESFVKFKLPLLLHLFKLNFCQVSSDLCLKIGKNLGQALLTNVLKGSKNSSSEVNLT